jgi:hypothetical protein
MRNHFKRFPLGNYGQPVVTAADLVACQRAVREVHVDDKVRRYLMQIVHETRAHDDLSLGASPRAGIALINSIGNLSGWIAPFIVGWLLDATGSASAGLYVVAGLEVLAAVLIVAFIPRRISD